MAMCRCVGGRWCGLSWEVEGNKIHGTVHISHNSANDQPAILDALPDASTNTYHTYIYTYETLDNWSIYTPGDSYPMPYQIHIHGGGDDGGTPVEPEPDPEPTPSLT